MATALRLVEPASDVLSEKRIARITVRLSDTLKNRLEEEAESNGTTLGNHVNHRLAMPADLQELCGRTLADIRAAKQCLMLLERDGARMTMQQRLWVLKHLHRVQGMVLAGKGRKA
jgi:hypothetical protein